jgi:pimeloyl-ACP methyl ester carboxylesterase
MVGTDQSTPEQWLLRSWQTTLSNAAGWHCSSNDGGRGKSGGAYGEGLCSDGSGYSCDVEIAIAGFDRAVEDVDAVVNHLLGRTDVNQERLLIGGVSRGGILAIAYAGMRPSTSTADGLGEGVRTMKSSIRCFSSEARQQG